MDDNINNNEKVPKKREKKIIILIMEIKPNTLFTGMTPTCYQSKHYILYKNHA